MVSKLQTVNAHQDVLVPLKSAPSLDVTKPTLGQWNKAPSQQDLISYQVINSSPGHNKTLSGEERQFQELKKSLAEKTKKMPKFYTMIRLLTPAKIQRSDTCLNLVDTPRRMKNQKTLNAIAKILKRMKKIQINQLSSDHPDQSLNFTRS